VRVRAAVRGSGWRDGAQQEDPEAAPGVAEFGGFSVSGHRRAAAVSFLMTEAVLGRLAELGLSMRGGPAPDEVFAACWPAARKVARLQKAARRAGKRKAARRHETAAVELATGAMEGLVATWAQAGVRARFVEFDPLRWATPLVPLDQAAERYRRAREAA
jgi:hypothetical protein